MEILWFFIFSEIILRIHANLQSLTLYACLDKNMID
uniref:Uncharacterized protein n=1 Tax=Arundo donax TaxID=35708 RepID=A0A0A9CET3_ARUDO